MKLLNLLLENNWRPLSSSEIEDEKEELFDLINRAYAPLGGHPNLTGPNDVTTAGDNYSVVDLDDDPENDATVTYKNRPGGQKLVAMGHDGSKPARSAAVSKTVSDLNKNGFYIEVSGTILDILKAKGVAIVDDEATVKSALKGKDIKWHGDGSYDRNLGGKVHRKVMMGKPNVK
jgi:hypothetical protein|tara:strand:+ start:1393 stop:1917 length:525 start_codon:yes stop_codon:yes gene_type:complete